MSSKFPLITVLGPTAVGKTTFAAHLAFALDAEIISADSRQVFSGMDIGTGKDLRDYVISGHIIPSYLIDIAEPGTEYNVFQFQRDFKAARNSIISMGKTPILCGGTGLYLESVLLGYNLVEVPVDEILRAQLAALSIDELIKKISMSRPLHNTTDTLDRDRLIRAIEIENFKQHNENQRIEIDFSQTPVFGIRFDRKIVRERITARLTQRLNEGMIEEVQNLLNRSISKEQLMFYGLEYKYVTQYLSGELTYNEMFRLLNTAIHQFAKRQMTWFRRMENKGLKITWLEGEDGMQMNLNIAINFLKSI
jgi:tRNA dimethylallyltransferase